jgi:hypothetical protein
MSNAPTNLRRIPPDSTREPISVQLHQAPSVNQEKPQAQNYKPAFLYAKTVFHQFMSDFEL